MQPVFRITLLPIFAKALIVTFLFTKTPSPIAAKLDIDDDESINEITFLPFLRIYL